MTCTIFYSVLTHLKCEDKYRQGELLAAKKQSCLRQHKTWRQTFFAWIYLKKILEFLPLDISCETIFLLCTFHLLAYKRQWVYYEPGLQGKWSHTCKYLRVIQMTIFKNLEEDIEGIRVSFLNLIYKNQSEGFLMDCFSESSPITITHITWWGTNELTHTMPLHVLTLMSNCIIAFSCHSTQTFQNQRKTHYIFPKITYIILFPEQQIISYLKQALCIIVTTVNKRKYWNLTQKWQTQPNSTRVPYTHRTKVMP